ncbi:hypothetical protein BDF20DRAFT_871373 [Mycotypha africana]|uniref:uncharacterized protein n=1 Tax=Mycotypha africana TaxID=64632 RepID=UPI002301AE2C|nr:uncharacterized protein BDF20DRAFT_871373 [Mycotypha africana]KAI8979741.1 hypothetical protein BDF20DRAFT_871373 [Mycotypha africana]
MLNIKKNLINVIPKSILVHIASYLNLKDVLEFAESHKIIENIVYESPEIWTTNMLFPVNDSTITDKFIRQTIPRITRLYGISNLTMFNLPLTWVGYFLVFDQFAHTIKELKIHAGLDTLLELNKHLCTFAGNLLLLQRANQIPISFKNYAFDDEEEYATAVSKSHLLDMGLGSLYEQLEYERLDDPPFEQLKQFEVTVPYDAIYRRKETVVIDRLKVLIAFLSNTREEDKVRCEKLNKLASSTAVVEISESGSRKRLRDEPLPPISSFDFKQPQYNTRLRPF